MTLRPRFVSCRHPIIEATVFDVAPFYLMGLGTIHEGRAYRCATCSSWYCRAGRRWRRIPKHLSSYFERQLDAFREAPAPQDTASEPMTHLELPRAYAVGDA